MLPCRRRCRLLLLLLAALIGSAPPAGATWSIILVDTASGEIGVAAATCLESLDLQKLLPVVVVGRGAGVAQSAVDNGAINRKKIFAELMAGTPPAQIIEIALEGDLLWKSRQYGVADLVPDAAGFTGQQAGGFKQHVTGSAGTLVYAIQGNVLTGEPVISAAVTAVTQSGGSLADRLMAGMQAAAAMGGDGRCSCPESTPTGCGSPPQNGFEKSAHIGFLLVARAGDSDGTCNGLGCATGEYWLRLNVAGQQADDPDPVLQLQLLYDAFKLSAQGHPDGLRSLAAFDADVVLGDGASTRRLTVALYDIDGSPITHGGAQWSFAHAPGSAGLCSLAGSTDHGDGTYTLEFVAGAGVGVDLLSLRVDDGVQAATLFPYPALEHRPALQSSVTGLSLGANEPWPLQLLGPTDSGGRRYALLLSASGSVPGQRLPGGLLLPLNPDRLLALSQTLAMTGLLPGSPGTLDALSQAQLHLTLPPAGLAPLLGHTLSAAWVTLRPTDFVSNDVSVLLLP